MAKRFKRREYENVGLAAARKVRVLGWFWARRCRKSTNLGSLAFDEMSGERGRTVIAASASLLLGTELVGMTLTATEQAAIVTNEASAVRAVFEAGSGDKLAFRVANGETDKIYEGLSAQDFAELYKSSKLEMRLYFDRGSYSRLKIIAPNPATARGWGGTVLRDESGYTPAGLERDLQVATKPITDTDPTFKIIYACNLCPDDRHPWFEMTLPAADAELPVNPRGNFYRGQTGMMIHRVTLADAYAAGHELYDDNGKALSYEAFCSAPGNKLGLNISYRLEHESGGTSAIDLMAMLTSQRRGVGQCGFAFVSGDQDFLRALNMLRALVTGGPVGIGVDVATTTKDTSNPTSVTVTEQVGSERVARMIIVWKERKAAIARDRLRDIIVAVNSRPEGGPGRRMCIDASNERYFADETQDALKGLIPVQLVIAGEKIHPPGYEKDTDHKTYLGDLYAAAINENRYALPANEYVKKDHRLVCKDGGRYLCDPDQDGAHGDTFDSGKLAEFALVGGSAIAMAGRVTEIRASARQQMGAMI